MYVVTIQQINSQFRLRPSSPPAAHSLSPPVCIDRGCWNNNDRYQLDFDVLESNLPGVWFRDGKGRGNFLTAAIQLRMVGPGGRLVVAADSGATGCCPRVPLAFRLLYEDQSPVRDQSLLKPCKPTMAPSADGAAAAAAATGLSSASSPPPPSSSVAAALADDATTSRDEPLPCSIGADGRCKLLFRILDVSSKHKKQRFRLRVEPDLRRDPTCVDVSFRDSAPIRVVAREARGK